MESYLSDRHNISALLYLFISSKSRNYGFLICTMGTIISFLIQKYSRMMLNTEANFITTFDNADYVKYKLNHL